MMKDKRDFCPSSPTVVPRGGCALPQTGQSRCVHLLQDVPSEWPSLISKVWTPASGEAGFSTPQAESSLVHENLSQCRWSQQRGAAILVSTFSYLAIYSVMCTCSGRQQFQDGSHLTIAKCKPVAIDVRSASTNSLVYAAQQIHTASRYRWLPLRPFPLLLTLPL